CDGVPNNTLQPTGMRVPSMPVCSGPAAERVRYVDLEDQ
ncbi:MAG: hypothetical protein K0Q64_2101, partial [Nitrobacter vulgaris]|nr:hypothetical protein [Nitrobacter vulgaris]